MCVIAACGGASPAAELAPLPDDPSPVADAGQPPPQRRLAELIDGLASELAEVGGDCARAQSVLVDFGNEHADEAKELAEQIEERGGEQRILDRLAPSIESIQLIALSCPGIEMGGLFERQDDTSFGDAFAALAKGGATVHWRLGDDCHTWKLAGDTSGELLRMSPAPVVRFGYAVEGNEVVLAGIDAAPGPLSDRGIESSCREKLSLAAPDDAGVSIGDGWWYADARGCKAAKARPAPTGCVSSVSHIYVERPSPRDALEVALNENGSVSVVILAEGKPQCATWRFVGKRREKRLEREVGNSRVYFDAGYDGKTMKLTDGRFAVTPINPGIYRVGDHPWFIGPDCGGLKMATR